MTKAAQEYFYIKQGKSINAIYTLKDSEGNYIIDKHGDNVTSYTLEWANHLKQSYERKKNIKNIRIEKIE